MKKISVMIPCYNEEENVEAMYEAVKNLFHDELGDYQYEILFIDNKSKDNTRSILRKICQKDTNVRAIFNRMNFGQNNSPYYGLCQTTGDCAILLCCDFQDPLEMIPRMVCEWKRAIQLYA